MLYDALSMGKKTPKIAPSPWDFVTLQEEDRAMVIGNMPKKFVKDRACGSTVILADKQTHTHTHTDMLITILRNRSSGQSTGNYKASTHSYTYYISNIFS